MQRTIEITAPPAYTDTLIHELEQLEHVINLSVVRGASIKPPGDVLTVHVLNRGADQVMSLADAARKQGQVSVTTAELASVVDPDHERKVANDIDESLWEETETSLRQQSRITTNYVALMILGGVIAAISLVMEGASQAVTIAAAAIIAPGFEPLAHVPLGLALRRWGVVGMGLRSAGVGYLVLALSAALTLAVLRLAGLATVEGFVGNSEVGMLVHPTLREILVSACGAVAGMVMILSYRLYLLPGALIALGTIEAAATAGAALAAGRPVLIYEGAGRFVFDALLVVVAGVLIVLLKQATVHRRAPMV